MPRTAAVFSRLALALLLAVTLGLVACGGSRSGTVSRTFQGITNNGSLEVRSTPDGAQIFVNNHFVGTTPHRLYLDRGVPRVVLKKPGYKDYEEWPSIDPGKRVVIEAKLEAQ